MGRQPRAQVLPIFTDRQSSGDLKQIADLFAGWNISIYTDWSKTSQVALKSPLALFYIHGQSDASASIPREVEAAIKQCRNISWIGIATEQQLNSEQFLRIIDLYCYDYFTFPLDGMAAQAAAVVGHIFGISNLRRQRRSGIEQQSHVEDGIVGNSHEVKRLHRTIEKFARSDATVLISGESGTGKELVSQAIHSQSSRADQPFVAINCGAIHENLVESELFGYEKGAFTGANKYKAGLIESADGGTLFLDEVAELPRDQQVKLLRFLQEGTILPVGSLVPKQIDARVIAATHINLEQAVEHGVFREDLYFRLNVLAMKVPRLADREDDIEPLATHYYQHYRTSRIDEPAGFSNAAILALKGHHWPGNVRELMNRIQKALLMCETQLIEPADLGLERPGLEVVPNTLDLESARSQAEKEALQKAIKEAGNNISKAARNLGISRMTLYRLMEKHQIGA